MAGLTVRPATLNDIETYQKLQSTRWADGNQATTEQLRSRFRAYPRGMLVAEQDGQIVGMVFAMKIGSYDERKNPSWYEVTHNGLCDNHDPNGVIIFGVDLTTLPGVGARAGDALLIGIARLAIEEGVQWCMLGGRMPGYHHYQKQYSAEEYLWQKDAQGNFLDRQVQYYTSVPGLRAVKVLPNYFDDPDSGDYGVLLRWRNPLYGWPFPRVWSALFPVLFKLEDRYYAWRRHKKKKHTT